VGLPLRPTSVLLAAVLAVAACGGSQGTPSLPASSGTGGATASASPAATAAGPVRSPVRSAEATSPGSAPPFDAAAVSIDLAEVSAIPGQPIGVVAANDGSRRLFVIEQAGRIWLVRDGARGETPFLDMAGLVRAGGEQGLLGLAFHPDYPDDPRFFVYYTDREGGQRVATVRVSDDPDKADANAIEPILRMEDFAPNHNGGSLAFGPDGFLYVATGDGGGGGDPRGSGQNLSTYLGKILRLDVDNPSGSRPYGIPSDNPFQDQNGTLPEIWVTGLRNPWRTSFDRATGDFWIGDVGQGRYEEIDVVRAGTSGQNFGWNVTEGFTCFDSGDPCEPEGMVPPVTAYSHDFGCSVTGGYVYRGTTVTTLVGGYLFADYCSGTMWAIDAAAARVDAPRVVLESGRSISSFGEGEDGELYITDIGGTLLQVVPGG
jgi:glucose/arabinose dehydrogenase